MGWIKRLRERWGRGQAAEGQKSYSVQVLVGDEGFMVAQNFTGGDLYTVYTQAIWTYICASRISQDIANFRPVVQTRKPGSDAWTTDLDHDLNELLERPYGKAVWAPRLNWSQVLGTGVLREELGGNQFYRIVRGGDRLLALQLYLAELKANQDQTTGWFTTYSVTGYTDEIPVDQIVNIYKPNPCSTWEGVSPTIANEQATRVDFAASRRTRYDMETRVAPGVVFKVRGLFSLSEDQYTATKAKLAASYEGATKAGQSMVTGDDVEIQNAPLHQVDDIPTQADRARDSIISSFDVCPPMVGVLRDSKYQSLDRAQRAQYNLCIKPRLQNIYGTINSQAIFPIYGRHVRLWYDEVSSPLGLAAIAERGETAKIYQTLGWPAMHLNDRFDLQMPEFEGWDVSNMGAVVAGRGNPSEDPAGQAPSDEEDPESADDGDDEDRDEDTPEE